MALEPAPAANFEEAIEVTPLSSHSYAANLRLEWCIGTGADPSLLHLLPVLFRSANDSPVQSRTAAM
jgi:hypothetical protein